MTIAIIGAIALARALGAHTWKHDTDTFMRTHSGLFVEARPYRAGDTITFIARLAGPEDVRVHEDLRRSFHLWLALRQLGDGGAMVNCEEEKLPTNASSAVRTVPIPKNETVEFRISCSLHVSDDARAFVVDCPTYGERYRIERAAATHATVEAHGFWMPIDPDPADSLEYYTPVARIDLRDDAP